MRKGHALLGLSRYREAASVFEEGLAMDPINLDMKLGLEKAQQGILDDLMTGQSTHRCIHALLLAPSCMCEHHARWKPWQVAGGRCAR